MVNGRPGAPEKTLDQDEQARLAAERSAGATAMRAVIAAYAAGGPADPLGQLARLAGGLGTGLDNPVAADALTDGIDAARAQRFSWREIADALGEGAADEDARRIRERHRRWSKSRT